jgi:hypothetical protein
MFDEIDLAIAEIQQPRSRFQLENFVLGQHATVEMQYFQTCIELQDMLHKYRNAEITIKIDEKTVDKLRSSGDEIDALEADKLELNLKQTRLAMIGAQREIAHLVDIWNQFPNKFSRAEIEAAQPAYWAERLTANANAMLMAGQGVNPAHIEAMQQAGVLDEFVSKLNDAKAVENVRNLDS